MAAKKFPSDMSELTVPDTTDKLLIHDMTTGQTMWCTVAELFAAISAGAVTFASTIQATTGIFTNLTANYLPKHTTGGVANSLITDDGTHMGVKSTDNLHSLDIVTLTNEDAFTARRHSTTTNDWVGIGFRVSTSAYYDNDASIRGVRKASSTELQFYFQGLVPVVISSDGSLRLANDSAYKPGAGGLWTVVSDERIKKDIELADLDICYDTIKNIPLKRFAWADGVYSEEQVSDRHNLGWIAQDVQKYFSKAVSVKPFTKNAKIADGVEEYQEQDFVMEDKKVTSIEIVNGSPVQVTKTVQEKVLLFDEVQVKDELGKVVLENGKPMLYQVPKMITKTRPKFRQEVIEDCLDLNSSQLSAALYGAVQKCMTKIESLEKEIALLKQ